MAVAADVPLMLTELGTVQVTPLVGPETEQARLTEPVNPPVGVTEMVEVPPVPCVTVTVDGLAVIPKLGVEAAVTTIDRVVVGISLPEVPVMVAV
jgi:hypothetical protein